LSQEGLLLNGLDLDVLGAQTGVCGVVVEGWKHCDVVDFNLQLWGINRMRF
jgi:hypothetical protein